MVIEMSQTQFTVGLAAVMAIVGQALISGHAPGFGVMCPFVAIVYAIAWTLLDRRDA